MTAFGNHFHVEDETSVRMVSYNNGVASVFELPSENEADATIPYVEVLQDILLLDFRPLQTKIILM